jgi:hypothetical protein
MSGFIKDRCYHVPYHEEPIREVEVKKSHCGLGITGVIASALTPTKLPSWAKPDPKYKFQLNKYEGAVAITDMAGHHSDITWYLDDTLPATKLWAMNLKQ